MVMIVLEMARTRGAYRNGRSSVVHQVVLLTFAHELHEADRCAYSLCFLFDMARLCLHGKDSDTISCKLHGRFEGNLVNTIKSAATYPWALAVAWSKLLQQVVLDKKTPLGTQQLGGSGPIQQGTSVD